MKTFLYNTKAKLVSYAQVHPKRAKVMVGLAALVLLLIISALIAVIMRPDTPTPTATQLSQAPTAQIQITKDGFIPAAIVVKQGTKIIWTNSDSSMHQIQANPYPTGESLPGLRSEILNNTQVYEYIANTPGNYGYHDQLNPTTNGTLEVQE